MSHVQSHTTFVLVYVDDIIIIGSNFQEISLLITKLNVEFAFKGYWRVELFSRHSS